MEFSGKVLLGRFRSVAFAAAVLSCTSAVAAPQVATLSPAALEQCADAGIAECQFKLAQHFEREAATADLDRIRELYESAYKNGHAPSGEHLLRLISGAGAEPEVPQPAIGSVSVSTTTKAPAPTTAPEPAKLTAVDAYDSPLTSQSYTPFPKYPPAALSQSRIGTVTLQLDVKRDGSVSSASIHSTSGHDDLDQNAVIIAREWVIKDIIWPPNTSASATAQVFRIVNYSYEGDQARRYGLFGIFMGQSRTNFLRLVPDARCINHDELPAMNCYGWYRTDSGTHRVVAAFGSEKLLGAAVKFQGPAACEAARKQLYSINGGPNFRLPSGMTKLKRSIPGLRLLYWENNQHPDSIMIGCSDEQSKFFASVGPASYRASSKYVDATLLDR